MIKNPVKMVVVRCLILCVKFIKKSFVGRALPGPAGGACAPPVPLAGSWGKGKWKGRRGGKGKGKRKGSGRGITRMKIRATAISGAIGTDSTAGALPYHF